MVNTIADASDASDGDFRVRFQPGSSIRGVIVVDTQPRAPLSIGSPPVGSAE